MKDVTLRGQVDLFQSFGEQLRLGTVCQNESLQEGSECPLHGPVTINYNLPWRLQYVSDAKSMASSTKESYRHGVEPV